MKVMLVDPSLFTAPYDGALDDGLRANGVRTCWATRDLRSGEEPDLRAEATLVRFYPLTDGLRRKTSGAWKALKGLEHFIGLRLLEQAAHDVDIVHFQWAPLPALDARVIRKIARKRPVVLTVHDTEAFNGAHINSLQLHGIEALFGAAHHLIVHTASARDRLVARGIAPAKISTIAHGPLPLRHAPRPVHDKLAGRWRIVLFGRLQTYKGIDLVVEALGALTASQRDQLEVVVAGEPLMALDSVKARARELGLDHHCFQLREGRLGHQDMADLLGSADTFLFPYRAIEASGVLYLVAGLGKWLIASALGAFNDLLGDRPQQGQLIQPGEVFELAQAMLASIGQKPTGTCTNWAPSWNSIGAQTRKVYADLLDGWQDGFTVETRTPAPTGAPKPLHVRKNLSPAGRIRS